MGIPHHHGNGFPSSEFLHGVNIDSGLHKTGGEGMAQIVEPVMGMVPAYLPAQLATHPVQRVQHARLINGSAIVT